MPSRRALPASRSEQYVPIDKGQKIIQLKIYQGESREVKNNVLLGDLEVKLPTGAIEDQTVDVRFSYDVNGLLEVETTIVKTGHQQQLLIRQTPGGMDDAMIQTALKRLAEYKIAPHDVPENAALLRLLGKAYEEYLGEERQWVGNQISIFEAALATQDPKKIQRARTEVRDAITRFTGQMVL